MKKCCTCHELKSLEEFNRMQRRPDGRQPRCRDCSRRWYQINKVTHSAKTRIRSDAVKAENRAMLRQYLLTHPCVDCGETDLRVLEFDHRPGEFKLDAVSKLAITGFNWQIVAFEITKCDVRCANCHRIVTYRRANSWRQQAAEGG